jgi:hypothetical protein
LSETREAATKIADLLNRHTSGPITSCQLVERIMDLIPDGEERLVLIKLRGVLRIQADGTREALQRIVAEHAQAG